MLTCYNHTVRFPRSDLAYVGFRLAILDTLTQVDRSQSCPALSGDVYTSVLAIGRAAAPLAPCRNGHPVGA
jgi:hypothetical protein